MKPATIKVLSVMGYIYLLFLIAVLIVLIVVSFNGPETSSEFLKGLYEGATGSLSPMSSRQMGYLIGIMILPAVATVLMLFSIRKRSVKLQKTALVIFILLFLSGLGRGGFPIMALVFSVLLLLKPTREYFSQTSQDAPSPNGV